MISIGYNQWIGKRERQEDAISYAVGPTGRLALVLADGMGGHVGGDIASKLAVSAAIEALLNPYETISKMIEHAPIKANEYIEDYVKNHPESQGMGSTLISVLIDNQQIWWSSVGDSHLYLVRAKDITKLNADHSMKPVLEKMVANGELSLDAAKSDKRRNALRSAIMGDEIALVDISSYPISLMEGDIIILCSDGFDSLGDKSNFIPAIIGQKTAQAMADNLMNWLQEHSAPRQDNSSLMVALVQSSENIPQNENIEHSDNSSKYRKNAMSFWRNLSLGMGLCVLCLGGLLLWALLMNNSKSQMLAHNEAQILYLQSQMAQSSECDEIATTLRQITNAMTSNTPTPALNQIAPSTSNSDILFILNQLKAQNSSCTSFETLQENDDTRFPYSSYHPIERAS